MGTFSAQLPGRMSLFRFQFGVSAPPYFGARNEYINPLRRLGSGAPHNYPRSSFMTFHQTTDVHHA